MGFLDGLLPINFQIKANRRLAVCSVDSDMMNSHIIVEGNDPDALMYGFVVKGKRLRKNVDLGFRHFGAYNG